MLQLHQIWDSYLLHTPVGLIETPVVTWNNKIQSVLHNYWVH